LAGVAPWAGAITNDGPELQVEAASFVPLERQAAPAGAAPLGVAGSSYRWWLQHGAAGVGIGLGSMGAVVMPAGGATQPMHLGAMVPTVSVGLRYRTTPNSLVYADAMQARNLLPGGVDAYQAKVGVEWARRESPWRLDGGSLGLRLDSGLRMSLRLRKDKVGVYVRSTF
jgi:hypothetical protein